MDALEEQRLDVAIEVAKEMKLFTETEDNYDGAYLDYTVGKYHNEYGIGMVVLDYIELTGALTGEYAQMTRGIQGRGDSVLLDLSAKLKKMARRYQVAFIAFTQVSENARRDETIRDAGAIKDSKSIQNKADLGVTVFAVTTREMEKIQPLMSNRGLNVVPNIYYFVYKNRGNKLKRVRVFAYQDLSKMKVVDCFVTNENFEPINVNPTMIEIG